MEKIGLFWGSNTGNQEEAAGFLKDFMESEGVEMKIGAKVEVLDEARCLYVLMSSNDGLPRPYTITLMKIRLIETGEEGWTWSKAIEPDK